MREIWVEAKGFPDLLVSSLGYILRKSDETTPKLFLLKGRIYLNVKGGGLVGLHQIVARSFLDIDTDIYEINHKDGDRLNNAISNLEAITPNDNREHAYNLGLIRRPIKIRNIGTGEEYESLNSLAFALGYLSNPKIPKNALDGNNVFKLRGDSFIVVI